MVEEILYNVDVSQLIVEFDGYAKVIDAIVDVDQIIKDAPFESRFFTSL